MQKVLQNIITRITTLAVVLALGAALTGCVKQTSEDADILEDAGTQEGAAIVIDEDD